MRLDYINSGKGLGVAICLILFISIASVSLGQSVGQVTVNYIEALSAPDQYGNRVSAYVTVSSPDQQTVHNLSLSEFKALEDGIEVPIESVSQTDDPMSVVLAIDTSGSMLAKDRSGKTSMEAVKKASEIPKGRRAVVMLTDGKDEKGDGTCSIHSLNDVIDAATTKTIRVPIYTIGVGPQVDAKELGRMASLTGGRSMIAT